MHQITAECQAQTCPFRLPADGTQSGRGRTFDIERCVVALRPRRPPSVLDEPLEPGPPHGNTRIVANPTHSAGYLRSNRWFLDPECVAIATHAPPLGESFRCAVQRTS